MSVLPEGVRLLGCGQDAVLVELPDAALRRRLHQDLLARPLPVPAELVPAARTVLVRPGADSLAQVVDELVERLGSGLPEHHGDEVAVTTIDVRYDGEDLAQVAELCGISPREVVERHTGQLWTVEFAGFMPGFGYLSGDRGGLTVPRLQTPRTRIPAGSVALAGDFTGIYPQASPGGWQLIGSTDAPLWRTDRTPPALLVPGARIQFREVA